MSVDIVTTKVNPQPTQAPQIAASLPPTSLIICSRNRPQLLLETVESVLRGDVVPTEIVIIDQSEQADTDFMKRVLERGCDIRYHWTPSIGLCRATNAAIAMARHNLLVFTHDDVLVTPTWFETIVKATIDSGSRTVVTGQVRPGTLPNPGGFVLSTKVDPTRTVYTGRHCQGNLYPLDMAMYRTVINAVGSFDERLGPGTIYPAAEDSDFGYRLLKASFSILYEPKVVLYHRAWRTEKDYVPLRWSYGLGRGAFYAKHLDLHDRYMLGQMLRDVKNHFVSFVLHLRRERVRACGDGALSLEILYGAARWLLTLRKT